MPDAITECELVMKLNLKVKKKSERKWREEKKQETFDQCSLQKSSGHKQFAIVWYWREVDQFFFVAARSQANKEDVRCAFAVITDAFIYIAYGAVDDYSDDDAFFDRPCSIASTWNCRTTNKWLMHRRTRFAKMLPNDANLSA